SSNGYGFLVPDIERPDESLDKYHYRHRLCYPVARWRNWCGTVCILGWSTDDAFRSSGLGTDCLVCVEV
ncbi:MAG TPA: hypothetical protein VGK06_09635, partial [Methanosarcina sp.]